MQYTSLQPSNRWFVVPESYNTEHWCIVLTSALKMEAACTSKAHIHTLQSPKSKINTNNESPCKPKIGKGQYSFLYPAAEAVTRST
jgi:hypothetical protein